MDGYLMGACLSEWIGEWMDELMGQWVDIW